MSKYLFFDTETTGLPRDYKAPSSDTRNWPRMVQLAWILTDENGTRLNERNRIVKPEGFTIPAEAAGLHGITTERAMEEGQPLTEVISQFLTDLGEAGFIVGHNIAFDKKIVGAELVRLGREDVMPGKRSLCTMMASIDYCKLPGPYGFKYPKLEELHRKLFGRGFEDAHNALNDICATEKCFWD